MGSGPSGPSGAFGAVAQAAALPASRSHNPAREPLTLNLPAVEAALLRHPSRDGESAVLPDLLGHP